MIKLPKTVYLLLKKKKKSQNKCGVALRFIHFSKSISPFKVEPVYRWKGEEKRRKNSFCMCKLQVFCFSLLPAWLNFTIFTSSIERQSILSCCIAFQISEYKSDFKDWSVPVCRCLLTQFSVSMTICNGKHDEDQRSRMMITCPLLLMLQKKKHIKKNVWYTATVCSSFQLGSCFIASCSYSPQNALHTT